MKTLQELSDELGCYAVEEYYEPNDMVQLLTFMSHIVEHLQRLEANQSAVSAALEGMK